METTNRMDGCSEKLAKALLKLIGIILEGKMRIRLMKRMECFVYEIMEEAKFFYFLSRNYPELLNKFGDFFDLLWGNSVNSIVDHKKKQGLTFNIASSICDMQNKSKWKNIRVSKFGGIQPSAFDNPKTLQETDAALLVVKNYQYCWIHTDKSINENLALKNFPNNVEVDYVITFYEDSIDKTLSLSFFKVGKWE